MSDDLKENAASADDRSDQLSSRRWWTFRLLAVGGPILIGLAVLAFLLISREQLVFDEVTGRVKLQAAPIYLQQPGHELSGHRYLFDPVLGWRNIPNWSAETFGKKLTTNSRGLRDREYAYEKPPSTRRILVLGDSFAWGYGVADEEIFTEVLERRYEGAGLPWQVINSGVSGWGTDQELIFLVDEGFRYQPDVVVLAFFIGNDPVNNLHSIQYGLNKPLFINLKLKIENVPVPKPPAQLFDSKTANARPLDLTVRIIEEMGARCRKHNAQLVVMKFGTFQVPDDPQAKLVDADLVGQLRALRDPPRYLDLDAEFRRRGATKETLTRGVEDGHWNALGHRLVAVILEAFLRSEALVIHGEKRGPAAD